MTTTPPKWMRVRDAATILGVTEVNLRRAIARHEIRSAEGGTEVAFDGVRARRFGRAWRVWLGPEWMNPKVSQ